MIKLNQGIALLQVLIITAVLSVLGLFFTQSARQQVLLSQDIKDKNQALVASYDAEAKVLYALLTENVAQLGRGNGQLDYTNETWNLHGQMFSLSDTQEVALQDMRGLLSLNFPKAQWWLPVLTRLGLSDYDAQRMLADVQDWQDVDTVSRFNMPEQMTKNGVIQAKAELVHVIKNETIRTFIADNTSLYRGGAFNPMNAPDSLLAVLFDPAVANHLIKQRQTRELTTEQFTQLTDITENWELILYPSNDFTITIQTQVGKAKVDKTFHYKLSPRQADPVKRIAVEG